MNKRTLLLLPLFIVQFVYGQPPLVDGVMAVIGTELVLYSDIMNAEEQARQNGLLSNDSIRCYMLEDLMFEKLLVNQAGIDSVVIEDDRVEAELDRRIQYFVQQIGSEQALEEFYGKSLTEIRAEFRRQVRDQLVSQRMEGLITSDVRVTPKDVERFYNSIPEDSLPFINAEVEFAQIVLEPKPAEEEERRVKKRLQEYREQILSGDKDFCTLAVLYSKDPGSAEDCGELGLVPTGVMVPEFDAVALSLKDDQLSHVFKTDFGYHVMRMIERRGDQYNAQHILLQPQLSAADGDLTRTRLEEIIEEIKIDSLTFFEAVQKYSEDESSVANNGMPTNNYSGSTKWEVGALDKDVFYVLDKLKVGEISAPSVSIGPDGKKIYRVFKLLSRTEPHRAALISDYLLLKQAAQRTKRQEAIAQWITDKTSSTYIKLHGAFVGCQFSDQWKIQAQ